MLCHGGVLAKLGRATHKEAKTEKPKDVLENFEHRREGISLGLQFEALEDDLLDASQEEYQYVTQSTPRG